jgi:hypothetical protein
MTQHSLSIRLLWCLIASVCLFATQGAMGQQSQEDLEALLQQQQQQQQRARIEREISQLGQQSPTDMAPQIQSPSELRTDLPPMTDSTTDAADLLGTEYPRQISSTPSSVTPFSDWKFPR